jgi:hypothetical protein
MSSNTHPPKEALELHAMTKVDDPNRNTACTKDVAGTLRYEGAVTHPTNLTSSAAMVKGYYRPDPSTMGSLRYLAS